MGRPQLCTPPVAVGATRVPLALGMDCSLSPPSNCRPDRSMRSPGPQAGTHLHRRVRADCVMPKLCCLYGIAVRLVFCGWSATPQRSNERARQLRKCRTQAGERFRCGLRPVIAVHGFGCEVRLDMSVAPADISVHACLGGDMEERYPQRHFVSLATGSVWPTTRKVDAVSCKCPGTADRRGPDIEPDARIVGEKLSSEARQSW